MGLFDQIVRRFDGEAALTKLADQIAERCFEAVWQTVQGQLLTLAPAEARGYIRARGSRVLRRQVDAVANRESVTGTERSRLYSLTVNAMILRVQNHAQAVTRNATRRAA